MSRIRGVEVKVQKDVLQTRNYGLNEIVKKKNEDNSKDDVEKQQITELLYKLPKLDNIFEVHRKIGEGTFSSVYLGSLRQHSSMPDAEKRWFAIKHLVPTAHPARIEHELRCLQDIGGKDHVIGVELCLRHLDTIVFVMPYIPHRKFSEYVGEMDAGELREYMRALVVALRRVHSFGVIHRDVKPSNFLYDRDNRRYLLVDFGLAQRLYPPPDVVEPSGPPPAHLNNTRKRARDEGDSCPEAKRAALDLTVGPREPPPAPALALAPAPAPAAAPSHNVAYHVRTMPRDNRPAAERVVERVAEHVAERAAGRAAERAAGRVACACAGAARVCARCAGGPAARAPRAGTQGFRPPEVLLKYPHQTTAVDMWACGVVLASALSARYPFFRAADDVSALAELADLLGTAALQRAAAALGRRVVTSAPRRGLCLRKLCARLRGAGRAVCAGAGAGEGDGVPPCARCRLPAAQCLCTDHTKKADETSLGASVAGFPDSAFSLAARLLDPDPRTRISAADALRHPFLAAPAPTPTPAPAPTSTPAPTPAQTLE